MAEATVIDGKAVAAELRARVAAETALLKERHGVTPGLAVVLVGDDPASRVYVANKAKQTVEAGMASFEHRLSAATPQDELIALVRQFNADPTVDGILVQLPLPGPLDEAAVIATIDPDKDVDGLHVISTGRLWSGEEGLAPCTPVGCLILLKRTLGELKGKRALVLGRSRLVGKPLAALLLGEHCTVTMAHSRTADLAEECRRAEILVAAVGKARMVKGDWIRPGATVIDVGINRVPAPELGEGKTRLVGDVDYESAVKVAGAITPVPGGVGPMTIACLLRNTLIAACRRRALPEPAI